MTTMSAPQEILESVADLRLPPQSNARLQHLMDRNNEGLLSSDERQELSSLVELSQMMSLLRAKALKALGRRPT